MCSSDCRLGIYTHRNRNLGRSTAYFRLNRGNNIAFCPGRRRRDRNGAACKAGVTDNRCCDTANTVFVTAFRHGDTGFANGTQLLS